MEGSKTENKRGRKKGQKKLGNRMHSENQGSEDDSECGKFEAKSSTRYSQSSVKRNEVERSSPLSSSKCSQTSQQHQSKTTFQGQEQPIDEREYHFECPCGKDHHNKHTFTRHLREKHAYHLLSEFYIPVKQTLASNGFFSDFFKEHKKVIQEIQGSTDIVFPMPEELKNRLSQAFVSQALRKYKEMGIMMEKQLFDLYEERNRDDVQKSEAFLSTSVLLSMKTLTLKYLTEFQRNFSVFIKNISLSQLITLFLFNFASNMQRHATKFLTLSKMQLFETFIGDFEFWVNQNYAKVFSLNRIFYGHIEADSEYCRRERTWNISLLVQAYLEQQRKRVTLAFKPFNFILLCFQEYLRAEELIEQ